MGIYYVKYYGDGKQIEFKGGGGMTELHNISMHFSVLLNFHFKSGVTL